MIDWLWFFLQLEMPLDFVFKPQRQAELGIDWLSFFLQQEMCPNFVFKPQRQALATLNSQTCPSYRFIDK